MHRIPPIIAAIVAWCLLAPGGASAQRALTVEPSVRDAGRDAYAASWAVIIGINEYPHARVPRLRYAVNDARAVSDALLAQGFDRSRMITLMDQQATKARIEEALGDRLRTQVKKDDRVFVFFAGHGMTVRLRSGEEEGYLIPVDGDPARIYSTAISMSSLRQISDLLPAKHILFVVDACYSGYAVFNRAIADDLLDEMLRKPAIQILTAGRQGDLAQEKGGHGVFTDVLVRGLRGEAFGGRGWLALDQLGAWVRERVYAESNKRQVPQYGNLAGDGQFVFTSPRSRPSLAAVERDRAAIEDARRQLAAEREQLEAERRRLEEARRGVASVPPKSGPLERPEPPSGPPDDARAHAYFSGTTWKQLCDACDPKLSWIQFLASGKVGYNRQSAADFIVDGSDTWRIENGHLVLSWSHGYSVQRYRVDTLADRFEGSMSNVRGTTRLERVR